MRVDVAAGLGARSVAMPAVSAGVYGWGAAEVARVAVGAVREWGALHPDGVDVVRFVLFSGGVLAAFETALADR